MTEWILRSMRLALAMGAKRIGGHWDAIAVECLDDERAAAEVEARTIAQFRELASRALDLGLIAIYNEQMYTPSERPWTIRGARDFLQSANAGRSGVPIYLTVDVGHQAGMHYGADGEDLDYCAWLRALGPFCEVVHLQQTTPDASHHWPFTPEFNERGHVRVERVLDALREGYESVDSNSLADVLTPVEQQVLVAEIIPGSTRTESQVLSDLALTREYLREFIPVGGICLSY